MKAKLRSVRILLTVGFLIFFQSITVKAAVTYDILESGLPAMAINCENQMIFGDFNCDGYIDVLYQNGNNSGINIYYQEGTSSGRFKTAVKAVTVGILGIFNSGPFNGISFTYIRPSGAGYACLKAVDYDNDGDIDLIEGNSNTETKILKNNNGVFSIDTENARSLPTMPVNLENRMLFGDFDSDGDVDVLYQKSNTAKSEIYYQAGTRNGNFESAIEASSGVFSSGPFEGITFTRITSMGAGFACLRLVDYDNDGDIDLIEGNSGTATRILRNDKGVFNEDTKNVKSLPTMYTGCANRMIFGDFDSDGYVDVLYQLSSSSGAKIYYQAGTGNGSFGTAVQATAGTFNSGPFCGIKFTRILSGTGTGYICLSPVDYDNDGDIDLVEGNSGEVTRAITQSNAPPKIISSTPKDNSVDVSPTGNITLNFNEVISYADIGSILIKKTSDDSTVTSIIATDESKVSGIGTSTIIINSGVTLTDNTDYYISIEKRAFFNSDGQTFMGVNNKTTLNFTIGSDIIPEVLEIGTSNPPSGKVGTEYSGYTFTATGGTGNKTYAVTDGKLPEGLLLASDGILSGTPKTSGSSTFTVTVTDSATTPVTSSYEFTINIEQENLEIGISNLPSGKVGTEYSGYTFTSTGGTGNKTYAVTDGKLPEGLLLTSNGILSGTPKTSGSSTFTVTVTDSAITPVTSSYEFTINIEQENLEIGISNLPSGKVGSEYSGYTFTATGGTGNKTYAVTDGKLPKGLSLTSDGILSGTPKTSGSSTFTVMVTDSATTPVTSSYEFTINIEQEELTEVILAPNSLGNAGNECITGLELGRKYTVGISGTLNFVKADGTLSLSELDVENLGGTEIIELTNGNIYNVQLYTTSAAVAVVLTEDSLGVADDERITELKEGRKYKVIVDGVTEYVKADGTLSITKSDVGNLEGTEIKGLRNGTTYKVEVYKDKELYTLTYLAGLNGSIKGNLVQIINSGEAGDIVTAVPNTGYHFVSWSDGLTSASRTDSSISANINLSATFAENKSSSKHRRSSQITEYIIVPVTDSASANAISQTVIKRTTGKDGIKKDYIKYTIDKAKQTINALRKQGGNVARIVATDADKAVTETQVNIPNDTLSVLSSANINLQIETSGVIVSVPKESIQGLAEKRQLNEDLYFRLVPIKDEAKQKEIKTTVSQEQVIKAAAGSNEIRVIGTPMTIETNMIKRNVDIILPLIGVTLPTDALEREEFLNDIGVFVEHSDGVKVFQRGTVVEYKPGVFGIKFTATKFNHFAIIKLNNQLSINIETGWKYIDGTGYFF